MSFWCLQISQKTSFFLGFLTQPLKRGWIKKTKAKCLVYHYFLIWPVSRGLGSNPKNISLIFLETWRHQKYTSKLTDLYRRLEDHEYAFGYFYFGYTFAHFFELNCWKNATFSLKNYSRTSYPVLEHPFLLYNPKNVVKFPEKIEKLLKNVEQFTKSAGVGAKCDHLKLEVRTRVRAHLNLDVWGACVTPKRVATHTLNFTIKNVTMKSTNQYIWPIKSFSK